MRILSLLLLLAPTSSMAQSLPELFSVTGVETGDVLNIRLTADAQSAVIGKLDPMAKGVEVIDFSNDGKWALVNGGESSGWVSRRFLDAEPSLWESNKLPATLYCYGTEPFWSTDFSKDTITLTAPDVPETSYPIQIVSGRGFAEDRIRAVQAGNMTAVIFPQQCSDGMTERSYALQAVISLREGERAMLSGCCSISPN